MSYSNSFCHMHLPQPGFLVGTFLCRHRTKTYKNYKDNDNDNDVIITVTTTTIINNVHTLQTSNSVAAICVGIDTVIHLTHFTKVLTNVQQSPKSNNNC